MKPSIGRIVHYVMPAGRSEGQHRPAIIVRVWSDEGPYADLIQLQVFTDGTNDQGEQIPGAPAPAPYASGIYWATSVHEDPTGKAPGTWHWPERE